MVSFQSKFHELPMKYVASSKFDFENLHRDKLKQCRERVCMVQLNPNDRFFLLEDNLMVIKRNNSLSQQFKVADLGVNHKARVTLFLCKSKKIVQL